MMVLSSLNALLPAWDTLPPQHPNFPVLLPNSCPILQFSAYMFSQPCDMFCRGAKFATPEYVSLARGRKKQKTWEMCSFHLPANCLKRIQRESLLQEGNYHQRYIYIIIQTRCGTQGRNWQNLLKFFFSVSHCFYRSDQISRSVVSDSLRLHESQHARPPCPSQTPGVHSDSCP